MTAVQWNDCNRTAMPGFVRAKRKRFYWLLSVVTFLSIAFLKPATAAEKNSELLDLSLEELLSIQVTSVSKKQQNLQQTASAVYVISNEDIRRSGVTTIADALRMVPGVQVAQIDSSKWAISSRGFNGRFSNKLLVMVDGRTVYSPTYSGVNWYAEDLRLEDIARIEVVRGPGGSVWGANAVNGVINIITKQATDTLGGELVVGAGDNDMALVNARVGEKLGENIYSRFYINGNHHGETVRPDGNGSNDAWSDFRLGTRIDAYVSTSDTVAITADYGEGNLDQETYYPIYTAPYMAIDESGLDYVKWNLLTRWDHSVSVSNNWSLQLYYDKQDGRDFSMDEKRDTYDLDFTHRFHIGDYQEFMWGMGYRRMEDRILSSPIILMYPERRTNELTSAFFQDQLNFTDALSITVGAKWEHNDFTEDEFQPSAKVSWSLSDKTQWWSSISKAVRTPTIVEMDSSILGFTVPPACSSPPAPFCPPLTDLPIVVASLPAENLPPEQVTAYEMGIRSSVTPVLNIDLAIFYNDYSNLRTFAARDYEVLPTPVWHIAVPVEYANVTRGTTHGLELAAKWAPSRNLLVQLAYAYNKAQIDWGSAYDIQQNSPAPSHQLSLRTGYQFSSDVEINAWLRYVDDIVVAKAIENPRCDVDSYVEMDLNVAWQITPTLQLQVVGQNLLDSSHPEYVDYFLSNAAEIERSVYAKATVRF